MISLKNITYKIEQKTILEDISVKFEPSQLHLIIGANGAGKSTLIKLICNQIKPTGGTIFYENQEIKKISISEFARHRAVLSQNIELAFPLKVKEVVMMGRYPHFGAAATQKDYQAIEEAMEFFGVTEMAERDYLTLSGGEKQRVHFARVMAQIWNFPFSDTSSTSKNSKLKNRYLLLDEPLTFLDVRYQFEFMHKVTELLKQKDLVVIGVVHDLNLAAKFADQIVLLSNSKIVAAGTKEDVLTKENIKKAYSLEPIIHTNFRNDKNEMYLFFE